MRPALLFELDFSGLGLGARKELFYELVFKHRRNLAQNLPGGFEGPPPLLWILSHHLGHPLGPAEGEEVGAGSAGFF